MKPTDFPLNGRGLFVQHHKTKEGPNYFVILYKNSCKTVSDKDPKNVWRVLGSAKFTETGKALKEWAVETAEQAHLSKPKIDTQARSDTSFASTPSDEVEDTSLTKMIT